MKEIFFKKMIAGAATFAMIAQLGFALPVSADDDGILYSQDYESVTSASTVWKAQDTSALKLVTGDEKYGNYISYDFSKIKTNARSLETTNEFKADTSGKDYYVVEFDAALTAGNNQNTDLAVKTSKFQYSGNTANDGAGSGYLFKMTTTNSEEWTINNSQKVSLTSGSWYHYKLIVDTVNGFTSVTINDSDGKTTLDKAIVGIDGDARDITGFYARAGRYYPVINIDNILVREKQDTDEFGTLPAEKINKFEFSSGSTQGTVLPGKITPNTEAGATDSYYVDLSATGTLGHDIFETYQDSYSIDWKVIGLGGEDGYINILLNDATEDAYKTNLTTSENDTVNGSTATKAKINVRNGVSNWFAQIQATIHFTDADGEEASMTTTRNFAVLAAGANASQIFPAAGYPEAANTYADDLVGYKSSSALGINDRDSILGWDIYGGNGSRYIELAQEKGGDKYLDFTTGTGTGSTVAEINIGNITDEFVVDMVTKFDGETSWGYYNTTPNNALDTTAFSVNYASGTLKAGTESVTNLTDNKWYRLVISCNRKVGKYTVTVIDDATGEKIGTAEAATDDGKNACSYFASSFGGAANKHRYIKKCKIYYPTIATMAVNATTDTVSVPTTESDTDVKLDKNNVFTYNAANKKLTVAIDDVTSAILVVAAYNENGTISNVSDYNLNFENGKAEVGNITVPNGSKLFVWNSLQGMMPVTATVGEYQAEEPGTQTVDLTAMLTSTEGFSMSSTVNWSIDTDDENIVITPSETNKQAAVLSVSAGAPAGAVTITASCGSSTAEKVINLTTTGNSITFSKQTASLTIPFSGDDAVSAVYEAYTVDKDGEKTTYAVDDDGNATEVLSTITYTVLDKNSTDITNSMPSGVTFDTATGQLTVTDQAKSSVIYIKATNNDQTPLSRIVKVNIHGLSFAFGSNAPEDDSYTQVTNDAYNDKIGYGFADASVVTADGDNVTGSADYRFKVKVPNGNYAVKVNTTSASVRSEVVEGVPATTGITKNGTDFEVAVCDGVLDLTFLSGSKLTSVSITQSQAKTAGDKPFVYAIGDSTTNNTGNGAKSWGNCVGGGVTLPSVFANFSNNGMAGRDSVNFYNEGRVEAVLLKVRPGDYVTVNMGINSKETGEVESYYTLLDNYYVQGIIQRGAIPIILTATPQGPVGKGAANYDSTTDTFTCNRGTDAHNGDLRKIATKYKLNIIEMGYWGDDYFNSLTADDVTNYNDTYGTSFTNRGDLVKSWYPDHNHYYEYLGNKIGQYILDSVAAIAGGSEEFLYSNDTHINEQ